MARPLATHDADTTLAHVQGCPECWAVVRAHLDQRAWCDCGEELVYGHERAAGRCSGCQWRDITGSLQLGAG